MGKGKRDPSLFDDVVNKLELRPEQALFIDDAKGNIERAANRGLKVIRYTDRESFESELESQLDNNKP
jgi:putative hydrolase of the HAD superfamily